MPIVSSVANVDAHTQQGGARYVVEIHRDQDGLEYTVGPYLVQPGFDIQARMQLRVAELDQMLADVEAQRIIDGA